MEEEFLTPSQVAKRLRVDYTTVMHWIRSGLLDVETVQQGRRKRHRIRKAAIEKIKAPHQLCLSKSARLLAKSAPLDNQPSVFQRTPNNLYSQ